VVAQRWSCPWGELDIVLASPELLVFVEVKARRRFGPDQGGLLAVTPTKQKRLIRTASLFLIQYPQFADRACRFDVALVMTEKTNFALRAYIPGAFEL